MNRKVCPEVLDNLLDIGFKLVKDTPNSADSDLIMSIDLDEKEIPEQGSKIFKICKKNIQQLSVTVW